MRASRTDRLLGAIRAEIEDQRSALDAGGPLTSVSVVVHLHASGDVRRIQFRADRQREVRDHDRRVLLGERREER